MQLQKLEAALGEALFDRRRAPVVPTDIGRVLIAQARVAGQLSRDDERFLLSLGL